jgi:hypothetical protein
MNLCDLLQTMKLDNEWVTKKPVSSSNNALVDKWNTKLPLASGRKESVDLIASTQAPRLTATGAALDVSMSEDLLSYQVSFRLPLC